VLTRLGQKAARREPVLTPLQLHRAGPLGCALARCLKFPIKINFKRANVCECVRDHEAKHLRAALTTVSSRVLLEQGQESIHACGSKNKLQVRLPRSVSDS